METQIDNTSTILWGCDPQLAKALTTFYERWGPYSRESRKCYIFSLIRDEIDPSWAELQDLNPVLTTEFFDWVWKRYKRGRFGFPDPDTSDDPQDISAPCAGKINNKYVLSEIARRYGFRVLEDFIAETIRSINDIDRRLSTASFESLQYFASACGGKMSKRKKLQDFPKGSATDPARGSNIGQLNLRRAKFHPACRVCGRRTELHSHMEEGTLWEFVNAAESSLQPSSLYCSDHKRNAKGYFKAKRSQSKFDIELNRLMRQRWSATRPRAQSGDVLIDRFILAFLNRHWKESGDFKSMMLDLARKMVDQKITDRKKKIVMLLADGLNQSQVAEKLEITRQTVSKDLQSISVTHAHTYRLDLLPCIFGDD